MDDKAERLLRVQEISNNARTRIHKLTDKLLDGKMPLSTWHNRVEAILKESHSKTALLGANEKKLSRSQQGRVGATLRSEYNYLDKFRDQIEAGELSNPQIKVRATLYSKSVKRSFYKAELNALEERKGGRQLLAMRSLDPQSQHCSSCITHSTNGKWILASNVVLPGVDCECRANCRCRISYRYSK